MMAEIGHGVSRCCPLTACSIDYVLTRLYLAQRPPCHVEPNKICLLHNLSKPPPLLFAHDVSQRTVFMILSIVLKLVMTDRGG